MTHPRALTAAELDPLSRVTARLFVAGLGAVSLAVAITLSFTSSGVQQTQHHWLNLGGIAALIGAYIFLVLRADPVKGPVSHAQFEVFVQVAFLAAILNASSQIGSNSAVRDDWGVTCMGLALVAAAPFIPSTRIIRFTVQAAAVGVALALVQLVGPSFDLPFGIQILIAVTPSLAMGLGAAAYARSLLGSLQAAAEEAAEARLRHDSQLRQRLSDTDAMGELGALRRDVMPFLERLDRTGELAQGDEVRAAVLASELRRAIVERLERGSLAASVDAYSDVDSVGSALSERQRASLRALIRAAAASGAGAPRIDRVSLVLGRVGHGASGTVLLVGRDAEAAASTLAPFLRIMRMEFADTEVISSGTALCVTFGFDYGSHQAVVS